MYLTNANIFIWMKGFILSIGFISFTACVGIENDGLYTSTPYVKEISSLKEYDSVITSKQLSIIVFYAPWCAHCKHFVPLYIDVAAANKRRELSFHAVNCVKYNTICSSNEHVQGYPTIVAFNVPPTAPGITKC